ncbi:hypothetical protein GCM10007276_12380 [Agaricicola taiwanensis]|uniref:Uncharacterized protein n=1 Tax=Agaricicola taiwanensis TaxID=591372 RepID=A0A8J2VR13_9RHOB|nr:hypothetical protein [Agaricicola taiwanensis]GGE36411.1 hypothetical protein GCM10007276_12380 [Agaricicola taiwanensis]
MSVHNLRLSFSTGRRGLPGAAGVPGRAATISQIWNAAAVTDADPGGSHVAANTTNLAAIAYLYFDDLEESGAVVSAIWDGLDDTGNTDNRGQLHLQDTTNPAKWLRVQVTSTVTSGATYRKVPVSLIARGADFEDGDILAIAWYPVGIGQTATVSIGTVTDVDYEGQAAVVNVGTAGDAILDFTLRAGPEGPEGPQGPPGSGDVSSVDVSGGTTGLTTSGGPITSTGTIELAGTLNIANGGTGATSAPDAFTALKQPATTSATGVVELATNAEVQTGTDTTRAVTPAGLTAKEATAVQWIGNTPDRILTTDVVWTEADFEAVAYAATITLDFGTGNFNKSVDPVTGNFTLANPSNGKPGQVFIIAIKQDATGSRTISYGTNWKAPGAVLPALSTAANAQDYIVGFFRSSTVAVITGILKAVA